MGKATIKKQKEAQNKVSVYDEALRNHTSYSTRGFDVRKTGSFGMEDFCEYMIRSISDCDFEKYRTEKSFIHYVSRHLFKEYHIPGFMDQAWSDNNQKEFRFWFVAAGRGMSLYKTCTKEYMTKKETHLFLTKGRNNLTIYENIWLARARAQGVDPSIAVTLLKANPRMCNQLNDEFWLGVFKFFIKNPIKKGNKLGEVIDFLIEQKHINPTFTLKGRTVHSLIQLSDQWHYDLARIKKHGTGHWDPLPISNWQREYGNSKNKRTYEVKQILTGKELSREGNAMRHCVYSYKRRCQASQSFIFSMQKTEYETGRKEYVTRRCATIEVDKNKRIVQARGYCNRGLKGAENNVLKDWASVNGLIVNPYYW